MIFLFSHVSNRDWIKNTCEGSHHGCCIGTGSLLRLLELQVAALLIQRIRICDPSVRTGSFLLSFHSWLIRV
jgi:hypothetical protein